MYYVVLCLEKNVFTPMMFFYGLSMLLNIITNELNNLT